MRMAAKTSAFFHPRENRRFAVFLGVGAIVVYPRALKPWDLGNVAGGSPVAELRQRGARLSPASFPSLPWPGNGQAFSEGFLGVKGLFIPYAEPPTSPSLIFPPHTSSWPLRFWEPACPTGAAATANFAVRSVSGRTLIACSGQGGRGEGLFPRGQFLSSSATV